MKKILLGVSFIALLAAFPAFAATSDNAQDKITNAAQVAGSKAEIAADKTRVILKKGCASRQNGDEKCLQ